MADKIVLTNVKEKDDVFKWSELNCFYRTFAVALNSVNEAYYDIFLLLISAYGTFVVNGDRTLSFDGNDNTIRFFNEELGNIFKAKIIKNNFKSMRDMRKKVGGQLKENRPVIIPCDLFFLPYCKTYQEQHRRHYIIVNGIDMDKGIYHIIDNMHNNLGADTRYSEFMISTDVAYNMCTSFCKNFDIVSDKNYFWSIELSENMCFVKDSSSYLMKICRKLADSDEKEWFENKFAAGKLDGLQIGYYMEYINTKNTFYKLLDRFIMKNYISGNEVLNEHNLIIKLLEKREKIKIELALWHYKNDKEENEFIDKVNKLINEEKEVLKNIAHIIEEKNIVVTHANQYDKIYTIALDDNRIYDIWKNVNDGKMITIKDGEDKSGLNIIMKVDTEFGASSHSGIFIEFINGDKVLFGTLGKMNTAIHRIDENPEYELYMEGEPFEVEVNYRIRFLDNTIRFYSNGKMIYELLSENEIKGYGIFAKTWEKCNVIVEIKECK